MEGTTEIVNDINQDNAWLINSALFIGAVYMLNECYYNINPRPYDARYQSGVLNREKFDKVFDFSLRSKAAAVNKMLDNLMVIPVGGALLYFLCACGSAAGIGEFISSTTSLVVPLFCLSALVYYPSIATKHLADAERFEEAEKYREEISSVLGSEVKEWSYGLINDFLQKTDKKTTIYNIVA